MLDIKTTAEFVENKEIFEKLKSIPYVPLLPLAPSPQTGERRSLE
jgi:hypothetical protein